MPTERTIHEGGPVVSTGCPLEEAELALVLVHGRGGRAQDILGLSAVLARDGAAYVAPQAAANTWYPHSFLEPLDRNEPWLSSALGVLGSLVTAVEESGLPAERIVLGGFSQGACLASEFVARNARRYGALLVFSGGLIGPPGTPREYEGSLAGMPVFIGCSDVDPHIPVERVRESTAVLTALGASVDERIYPGMGHTIIEDEVERARRIVEAVG